MSDAKGRGLPYTTSGTRVTSIRGVSVSGFLAMGIPEGEDRSLGEEALETMVSGDT